MEYWDYRDKTAKIDRQFIKLERSQGAKATCYDEQKQGCVSALSIAAHCECREWLNWSETSKSEAKMVACRGCE